MRGKGGYPVHRPSVVRITPAYAGKSATHSVSRIAGRDHPRLCGEKSLISIMSLPRTGSPPPMRGKAARSTPYLGTARITPAYAGKRWETIFVKHLFQDHPRLCGEKWTFSDVFQKIPGSPPPMRGKVSVNRVHSAATRITPAYAGKSFHFPFKRTAVRDHPRLCGEKFWTLADSVKL